MPLRTKLRVGGKEMDLDLIGWGVDDHEPWLSGVLRPAEEPAFLVDSTGADLPVEIRPAQFAIEIRGDGLLPFTKRHGLPRIDR